LAKISIFDQFSFNLDDVMSLPDEPAYKYELKPDCSIPENAFKFTLKVIEYEIQSIGKFNSIEDRRRFLFRSNCSQGIPSNSHNRPKIGLIAIILNLNSV